jgi:hypothetical protein
MKKLLFFVLLVFTKFTTFSQDFGVSFYNLKEGYDFMDSTGKSLFEDCAKIVGVPIDSMISCIDIRTDQLYQNNLYSSICVVRSTSPIFNPFTEEYSDCIYHNYDKKNYVGKKRFKVFYLKKENFQKVILVMHY